MEDLLLFGAEIVTKKRNPKWDLDVKFDFFKDVGPEGIRPWPRWSVLTQDRPVTNKTSLELDFSGPEDVRPWPRWSAMTLDRTVTNTSFLELDFPEETATLAADKKRAEFQEKYRKFLFPEIYAAEEFSCLVKRKMHEQRYAVKTRRAQVKHSMEPKTQRDSEMKAEEKKENERRENEPGDDWEIIEMGDIAFVVSDINKPVNPKTNLLSCFCAY